MSTLPSSINKAIEALSDLPGIGRRSAERLVFKLLKNQTGLDIKLADALGNLKKNICECQMCCNFSEAPTCVLCLRNDRNTRILCIVETPLDLLALERTHEFKGLFHVLHGVISPLQKVSPEDVRLKQLFERIEQNPDIDEIIIALSGNIESEATALYITDKVKPIFTGTISRLARGIPTGGDLDYLDAGTLSRAMSDRRDF